MFLAFTNVCILVDEIDCTVLSLDHCRNLIHFACVSQRQVASWLKPFCHLVRFAIRNIFVPDSVFLVITNCHLPNLNAKNGFKEDCQSSYHVCM